jgi:threonine dehydrogenase-like Zn-dependent dehydrogenase
MKLSDRQVTVRMGQANVRRWSDQLLELVSRAEDVFDVERLACHHLPLNDAPDAYTMFRDKATAT